MNENLRTKITTMSTDELLNIIENKADYEDDFVEFARGQIKRENKKLTDESRYKVILTSLGNDETDVMDEIQRLTGYDSKKVNNLTHNIPCNITKNVNNKRAVKIARSLEALGAVIQIEKMEELKGADKKNNTPKRIEPGLVKENEGCLTEIKKVFKPVFTTIEVIVAIIIIYLWATGNFSLVTSDIIASLNDNDNPYIEMVQSLRPFEGGTYYEAFTSEFDRNDWKYLKVDGKRYVQVTSYYSDINDKMITQFSIIPTDEKGQFSIELYAMRVSGQDLSKTEMSLVLAAVFKGDVVEKLGRFSMPQAQALAETINNGKNADYSNIQDDGLDEEYEKEYDFIMAVRRQLGVPDSANITYDISEKDYWPIGECYYVCVYIYENGEIVAQADVDADTGELIRNVSTYKSIISSSELTLTEKIAYIRKLYYNIQNNLSNLTCKTDDSGVKKYYQGTYLKKVFIPYGVNCETNFMFGREYYYEGATLYFAFLWDDDGNEFRYYFHDGKMIKMIDADKSESTSGYGFSMRENTLLLDSDEYK